MNITRKTSFFKEKKSKILFLFVGMASIAWFLFRVIPKPSRASYPCMRATFPVATGFVIYLISLTTSWYAFRKFRQALRGNQIMLASMILVIAFLSFTASFLFTNDESKANTISLASHTLNEPFGNAIGIFPGRVVWVWDKFATNQNCKNTVNKNGVLDDGDDAWFMDKNTDQMLVSQMVSKGIQELTGKITDKEAWEVVFKYHNNLRGKGETGYQPGEKILIKLNRTSTNAATNVNVSTMARNDKYSRTLLSETSPHIVLAVLRHLVYKAGVPQNAIYVGDPMRNHYQEEQNKYVAEFPDVNYLGTNIYQTNVKIVENGRKPVSISNTELIYYSDKGTDMPDGISDKLYSILEEADYLINLPMMKGHATGGITVFPKNHFGSQSRVAASHLHTGLVDKRTGYGKYRVQVDIMGSEHLGKKNLIYILDALWAGPDWGDNPVKFEMSPFNDDWTSSIFLSFDPVAIESVAFDFLRTEFNGANKYTTKAFPNMLGCDDYLHQAASEAHWPAGIVYTPDANKIKISSLGVHEHWNNPTDKKYSRNLGTGSGIEMVPLLVGNHPPYQIKEFSKFEVTNLNETVLLVADLYQYFKDYENNPVSFSASTSSANAEVSVSGNALNITIFSNTPQYIPVVLTASDGTSSFSTLLEVVYTENVDVEINSYGISAYPNPVRNVLFLSFDNVNIHHAEARIFDITGKLIYTQSLQPSVQGNNSMDVSGLSRGTYILEISHMAEGLKKVVLKNILIKE